MVGKEITRDSPATLQPALNFPSPDVQYRDAWIAVERALLPNSKIRGLEDGNAKQSRNTFLFQSFSAVSRN